MIRDAIFIIVVFLANVIQAITGFAGTLLAMPASIHLIGVADAKAVLNMLPVIGCIMIAVQDFSYIRWKELCKICAFMLAGMLAGAKLFELLPLDMLLTAYGVMIVVIAALRLFGVPFIAMLPLTHLLLTAGEALAVFALALLLLWTGVSIAVAGCTLTVRLTRSIYRSILYPKKEENGDE